MLTTVSLDDAYHVIVKLPDLSWQIAEHFKNIHWFDLFTSGKLIITINITPIPNSNLFAIHSKNNNA
jgi:hypothetical protein